MENETTLKDVLEAVKKGFTHVQTQIGGVETKVGVLTLEVGGLRTDLKEVEKKIEKKIDALTNHVDGFAKKQLDFDAELAAERSARKRLEERIA